MWGFSKSGNNSDDTKRVIPITIDPVTVSSGDLDSPAIDIAEPIRSEWRAELAEVGGPNALLHFPRDTAIEFSVGHPGGLAQLFAGSPTLLRNLVRDDLALHRARHNAIRINDKGIELQASRGIDSVYLAVGLVTWSTDDTEYCAPMLVRPVRLRRRADDIEITFKHQGDSSAPWTTFASNPAGYIVERTSVDYSTAIAASQKVRVFTVTAGFRNKLPRTPNEVEKFSVKFYKSAAVSDAATVA